MEIVSIKNRVGILDSQKNSINNIKVETKDSISKADIEIIRIVLRNMDISSECKVRYAPEEKGSFLTSLLIEFSDIINKETIETFFWLTSNILTNYGAYNAIEEVKVDTKLKKEKFKQEEIETEKQRFLLDVMKESYEIKKNINNKYAAMSSDEEVSFNESIIVYNDEEEKLLENKGDFSSRITHLKAYKDIIKFGGTIKIHSLVVDGDNKWRGYYSGDDVMYEGNTILKSGQPINFKIEDESFKKGLVSNGSLSVEIIIYALLKVIIEITDEIKPKDFIILEVFRGLESMNKALDVQVKNEKSLFDFAGINLK